VAASGAAGATLVSGGRPRAVAMLAALLLAPALVAGDVWDTHRFAELRESPGRLVVGALAGLAGVGVLAAVLARRPTLFPLLALAALPIRVPIDLGGEDANLLVPLYAVIAGGAVASALVAWRQPASREVWGDGARRRRVAAGDGTSNQRGWRASATRALPWLLAAFVVLYALQSAYSDDASKAVENVSFFFIPFTVLFALLSELRWTPGLLRGAVAVVVGEALLFSLVGFGQFATERVFWNPEVIAANEVHTYFRVNSLFWDPNVLGRYLVLAILALAAYMVWTRDGRGAAFAAGACVALLAAIALTFSQSSLIALLAGLVVLAALRWGARWALVAITLAVWAGVALLALSGADVTSERSLDIRTSGRVGLVRGGLDLATDRPFHGYGSGSFQDEFKQRFPDEAEGTGSVSHTEPVTVAAEQGLIGLAPYLALLAAAVGTLLATPAGMTVARAALLACLGAMVVHSLAYAGLLIDPVTWALLGIGLALVRYPVPAMAPATATGEVAPGRTPPARAGLPTG
jgi:putative inorganic carbon (HCO3(-)) transporter